MKGIIEVILHEGFLVKNILLKLIFIIFVTRYSFVKYIYFFKVSQSYQKITEFIWYRIHKVEPLMKMDHLLMNKSQQKYQLLLLILDSIQ